MEEFLGFIKSFLFYQPMWRLWNEEPAIPQMKVTENWKLSQWGKRKARMPLLASPKAKGMVIMFTIREAFKKTNGK